MLEKLTEIGECGGYFGEPSEKAHHIEIEEIEFGRFNGFALYCFRIWRKLKAKQRVLEYLEPLLNGLSGDLRVVSHIGLVDDFGVHSGCGL